MFQNNITHPDDENEHKQKLADKECQILTLEETLKDKTYAHDKGCKTIQYMMIRIKSLEADLNRLKNEQLVSVFYNFFFLAFSNSFLVASFSFSIFRLTMNAL